MLREKQSLDYWSTEKTPLRLKKSMDLLVKLATSGVNVEGREHLEQIEPGQNVIIATSHISDADIPIVAHALGDDLNAAISNQSIQHTLTGGDVPSYLGMLVAGKGNFLPVSYKVEDGKKIGIFDTEDYDAMKQASEKGKSIIIAAHSPVHDWQLPDIGGYGAVYLAEIMENSVILPVSVSLESDDPNQPAGMSEGKFKTLLNKPKADVKIGAPFQLEKTSVIKEMREILIKQRNGEELSDEENQKVVEGRKTLRYLSDILMSHIAGLLPNGKKGNIPSSY